MKFIPSSALLEIPDMILVASDKELKPYGVYLMENGDRILFNRSYSPMLHWEKETGQIKVMDREWWVRYESQVWFYNDGLPVKKTSRLRQVIMNLWLSGYAVLPDDMPAIERGLKELKAQYR